MKLRHKTTGLEVTVSHPVWLRKFRDDPEWVDITPPLTEKQKQVQERFVKLGKLYRTKANLQDVEKTFGPYHGVFCNAIRALDQLIKQINPPKP